MPIAQPGLLLAWVAAALLATTSVRAATSEPSPDGGSPASPETPVTEPAPEPATPPKDQAAPTASPVPPEPLSPPSEEDTPTAGHAAREKRRDEARTKAADAAADKSGDDKGGDQWGTFTPGNGFTVASTSLGSLNIGLYMLARWLDQLPATQSFTDHLGDVRAIDTRNDIQLHRVMVFFSGHVYDPELRYSCFVWTSNSTTQVAIAGNVNYTFGKALQLAAGFGGLPGTRSMTGVFPYWFATDRQMADELFRPGFTGGVWASGDLTHGLQYRAMLGDNLSLLGVNATQLTRSLAPSASVWWMPTTGEFGPRGGGFGDYEIHDRVATRFGTSFTYSRENRFSQPSPDAPDNTQVRLTDSLLLFAQGSLAPGVTVIDADYKLWAIDAGIKYQGFALHTEYYFRVLDRFVADGLLPRSSIFDHGFYVQTGYQIARPLAVYGVTSAVFGPFGDSWEAGGGLNIYPANTRNWRLNAHSVYVHKSAASSSFGYYIGGQTGPIVSLATDVFF